MRTAPRSTPLVLALGVAASLAFAAPGHAQQGSGGMGGQAAAPALPGVRGEVIADLNTMEEKMTGLARVMAGKYDWRPGTGVRSVGEVFNHVIQENGMLPRLLTAAPRPAGGAAPAAGGGARPAQPAVVTDPADMQENMRRSYAALRDAIAALPESSMDEQMTFFGRTTTRRGALLGMLNDMHEHLGQSIAYARMNGVTPPWSEGK